jgi:phosphoribosylanthranilate isomerase
VKVCGLTRDEDVATAAEAGADLAGFIFVSASPRAASEVLAVPGTMLSVAVWVGEAGESRADLDQVYERLDGKVRGRNAVVYRKEEPVARLLDLPWGEDDPGHWTHAAQAARRERVVLAGGLGPANVRSAVSEVRPWGVDAASSLEVAPGIKDADLVRTYVAEASAA